MTGTYHIIVEDDNLIYEFDILRNITVLRGDTATGKTTLVDMISEYETAQALNGPSMIRVVCDKRCTVLNGVDWKNQLAGITDAIVFIDEGFPALADKAAFVREIKGSDNYYVIITREKLEELPYSITEIYNITHSDKYAGVKRVYNELSRVYDSIGTNADRHSDVIITEDSGSGFEMFTKAFPNCKVETARGKSNIIKLLRKHKGESVTAVVDGAAFGPEMETVINHISMYNPRAMLYAPESFEYLLLCTRMCSIAHKMIEDTAKYADSRQCLSWEQFYEALLKAVLQRFGIRYDKSRMPRQLINERFMKEFIGLLPNIFEGEE